MHKKQFATIKLRSGATVFEEGDQGDSAFVIVSGEVVVQKTTEGKTIEIAKLGANQMIGEMSLLSPGHRTASVVALTDCELLHLDQKQFARRRQNQDPIIKMVFDVILNRFRNTLHSIGHDNEQVAVSPHTTRDMEAAMSQLRFETDIGRGLDAGEFELHYQPIVCLKSGTICGAEGLMRWNHPEKGMIYPGDFINAAEVSDLIREITKIAVETACADLAKFQAASLENEKGARNFFLSVNVSGRDLDHEPFFDFVRETTQKHNIPVGALKLEVTETSLMNDMEVACERLLALREAGLGIAIDDFGTGYSSMSYLTKLPLTTLKIDRVFVSNIAEIENSQKITNMILNLARELELVVVAEGIETVADSDHLAEKNCTYGQGFLFSKAVPAENFTALLKGWEPGQQEEIFPEMLNMMAV